MVSVCAVAVKSVASPVISVLVPASPVSCYTPPIGRTGASRIVNGIAYRDAFVRLATIFGVSYQFGR